MPFSTVNLKTPHLLAWLCQALLFLWSYFPVDKVVHKFYCTVCPFFSKSHTDPFRQYLFYKKKKIEFTLSVEQSLQMQDVDCYTFWEFSLPLTLHSEITPGR